MFSFLRHWLADLVGASRPAAPRRRVRLRLERLDDRICPTVTYQGGNILDHVQVQGMYLGSNWYDNSSLKAETGKYEGFLKDVVNSGYMDMLTNAGYGVHRGTWTQGIIARPTLASGSIITDSQIRGYIQSNLPYLATPNSERLYMVFVEPNVIVQMGNGDESVHNFLGYHTAFTGTYNGQSVTIRYGVMAYPSGSVHNAIVPGLSAFDSETKVASHELVEAVTDPDVGYSTLGWYDRQYNQENGDLANTKFGNYTINGTSYVVQYQVDRNDQYIFPTTNNPPSTLPGYSFNVATFPGGGLWRYGTSWVQLTTANPIAIGVNAYGDVAAAFDGGGTWEYVESLHGWYQLTAATSDDLGIDDSGDVAAHFSGAGLWVYTYGQYWNQITTANPSLLAVGPNGNIAAEFDGGGVWRYSGDAGWGQLTGADASILQIDANGNVLANFLGAGVWRFSDSGGWSNLTSVDAVDLGFDHSGNVSAVFQGGGTWVHSDASGWSKITSVDAYTTTFDSKGYLLADFTAGGLWRYSPETGWVRITPADVDLLI